MKIADVDFPQTLLTALEDKRLVIFAGAGVSMGTPANLPDFGHLAQEVARSTGEHKGRDETNEQFLGRLQDRGVTVHHRASRVLQDSAPQPTDLHRNVLRLYGRPEDIKAVTTNFDDLFETASLALWDNATEIFRAPALPLGSGVEGIVHLHGWVHEAAKMVLTHEDFGRAYLTESDGWARRFLRDLFANYVVLFVGYSHEDTIRKYITPSSPPEDQPRRFALVGDRRDDLSHWRSMGVEPVVFHQEHAGDFAGLDAAVAELAQISGRGLLDWQREINQIAERLPPIDDQSTALIKQALTKEEHTRFFMGAAASPEWI